MARQSGSAAVAQTGTLPELIDLEELEDVLEGAAGDRVDVSLSWLARVRDELRAARKAKQLLDEVFGPGQAAP